MKFGPSTNWFNPNLIEIQLVHLQLPIGFSMFIMVHISKGVFYLRSTKVTWVLDGNSPQLIQFS